MSHEDVIREVAWVKTDKIVLTHVYPPIPTRKMDWCAYYDGEEEEGNYGWGATRKEALIDLIDNSGERYDYY